MAVDVVLVDENDNVLGLKEKAADYKWISITELENELKENPGNYTPWFKIIMEKVKKIGNKTNNGQN